jgi:hypothetical protein
MLDLCYRQDVEGLPATKVSNDDMIFDFRRFDVLASTIQT